MAITFRNDDSRTACEAVVKIRKDSQLSHVVGSSHVHGCRCDKQKQKVAKADVNWPRHQPDAALEISSGVVDLRYVVCTCVAVKQTTNFTCSWLRLYDRSRPRPNEKKLQTFQWVIKVHGHLFLFFVSDIEDNGNFPVTCWEAQSFNIGN
jgi:hypothetical protein